MGCLEFLQGISHLLRRVRPSTSSSNSELLEDFITYAGAIILDETHERCLLVKGCKGPGWSFPCGKKCKDEEDHACAIRKVLEEIGYDISFVLNKKEYFELTNDEQRVRLYIVAGVSEDRPFAPLTEGEINEITWHPLDRLGDLESFMVAPFIPELKKWIVNNPSPLARTRLFTSSPNSELLEDFTSYVGAIILDETHERCLLVKGCKGPSWSFPFGKKCKDEEDHACAIREVLEEIGCDISYQLNKKEYLELTKDEQRVRLYIVAGVSEDRPFEPLTKGEISEITWYPLDHLQALKSFMVAPCIPLLKKWIVNNPSPLARRPDQSLKELCVWSARLGGKRTTTEESYTRELEIKFGSLTFDQYRAAGKGHLVMQSNNTKPEMETTTLRSRNTKSEPKTRTFGSLTFDLSTI